jgi:uncharacterized membrane protein YedE/YeeE
VTIDWNHFTPGMSLLGGILIGLAAVMLLYFKGRIAGVSGVLGALLQRGSTPEGHYSWRIAFIAGLLLSSAVYGLFAVMPAAQIDASYALLVIAGLLVGFGTRMGSGCTSGHAVCGLARLSTRSIAATASFMVSGFVTAYVLFHVFAS